MISVIPGTDRSLETILGVTCDLFRQVMQCFANNAKRNLFSINGNGKNEETEIKRNSFYFYNEHDNI